MREKREAYEQTLNLIQDIKAQGDKIGWRGIGPVAGTIGSKLFQYTGLGSNVEEEKLRSMISQLRARASFQEGGKQFTGSEKALLDAFLATVSSNPTAARARLEQFEESARKGLAGFAPGQAPRGSPDTEGSDLYQKYLQRFGGR